MQDMKAQLEKLRVQIAECEMIRDLATAQRKRDLFAKLAEHYKLLANEIEKAISERTPITLLGRKTHEPFPNGDK